MPYSATILSLYPIYNVYTSVYHSHTPFKDLAEQSSQSLREVGRLAAAAALQQPDVGLQQQCLLAKDTAAEALL